MGQVCRRASLPEVCFDQLVQDFVDQGAARVPQQIETALPVFSGRADEGIDEFVGARTCIQMQHPAWDNIKLRQAAVARLVGLAQEWQDRMGHEVANWPAWSAALGTSCNIV